MTTDHGVTPRAEGDAESPRLRTELCPTWAGATASTRGKNHPYLRAIQSRVLTPVLTLGDLKNNGSPTEVPSEETHR